MTVVLVALAAMGLVLAGLVLGPVLRCVFVTCEDCPQDITDTVAGEPDLEAELAALFARWRAAAPGGVLIAKTDQQLEDEATIWERYGFDGLAAKLRAGKTTGAG